MSETGRGPCNGLAKLISDADPDTPPGEILAQKQEYECPDCGWRADLQRRECMVCEYDSKLHPQRNYPNERRADE